MPRVASEEGELLKSVVDLAMATRGGHDFNLSDDWLTFDALATSLKEVCYKAGIADAMEQRCYHALLKMSAEPDESLTWWDKLNQLNKYLPATVGSAPVETKKDVSKSRMQRSYPSNSTLIRLGEDAPATTPTRFVSSVSGSSPGSLIEGQHLSMLLNSTGKFNRKPFAAAATVVGGAAHAVGASLPTLSEQSASTTQIANNSQPRAHEAAASGSDRLLDVLTEVAQRVDSVEKETRNTRNMIAKMSPSQQQEKVAPEEFVDRFVQQTLASVPKQSSGKERSQYPKSDAIRSTVLLPGSPPKANASAIGEFSNLLRMSKAMNKYMNAPSDSSSRLRAAAGYQDAPQSSMHSPLISDVAKNGNSMTSTAPLSLAELSSDPVKRQGTVNNSGIGTYFSPPLSPTPLSMHPSSSAESPASYSPHQQNELAQSRNVSDALNSVQQQQISAQRFTPLGDDFLRDSRGNLDVDALCIDTRSLPRGGDVAGAVSSAVHVLLGFHTWLLDRTAEHVAAGDMLPTTACLLNSHLQQQPDFVTSLFGMEQWLRDNMKRLLRLQIISYLFRHWHRKYGIPPASRVYRLRSLQRRGFEALLEYSMRRRMRRKNALHALAVRRRHVNVSHMTPSLQRKRPLRVDVSYNSFGAGDSRRTQVQRQLFFSSLRVRDVLHDAREVLLAMSRGAADQQRTISLFEYRAAQQSVAQLFAFRRLIHRTLLLPRMQRVRLACSHRLKTEVLSLWRDKWDQRHQLEIRLEPRVQEVHSRVLQLRMRNALLFLQQNVSISRKERRALDAFGVRIRARPLHLRALHMLRCSAFVKCFFRLKKHYEEAGLLPEMRRYAQRHRSDFMLRQYLRRWRLFMSFLSDQRRNGCRTKVSKFVLLLLLRRRHAALLDSIGNQYTPISSFLASPQVQGLHISSQLLRQVSLLQQQWRAFVRLRSVGRCPRVFFSLLELRFAQSLSRRAMPSERRKYLRMVNEASCRIMPTQFLMRLVREKVSLEKQYSTALARQSQQNLNSNVSTNSLLPAVTTNSGNSRRHSRHIHISDSHHSDFDSSRLVNAEPLMAQGNVDEELQELYDRVTDRCVSNATIVRYLPPEKPYVLIFIQPATLALNRRVLFDSTPFEPHEDCERLYHQGFNDGSNVLWSARFLSPYHRQPIVTSDGSVFATTPLLLRMTRRWRLFSDIRSRLRRLHDSVAQVKHHEVLSVKWQQWRSLYHEVVECNNTRKRKTLLRFKRYRHRLDALRIDRNSEVRVLQELHWLRWLDAHSRHVDLRRLHAGHFYNCVVDGTRKVLLHFVSHSTQVPFSLRHFLIHFPSYRFPVHERPNPLLWESQQHQSAHLALLAISRHHHYHPHHDADTVLEQASAHYLAAHQDHRNTSNGLKHQDKRPVHLRDRFHINHSTRRRIDLDSAPTTTAEVCVEAISLEKNSVPAISELASAAIFMSSWLSVAIRQFYRMRRALLLLRGYCRMNRRIRGVVEVVEALRRRDFVRMLRKRVLLRCRFNSVRRSQRQRWMHRIRWESVRLRFQKQFLRHWLGNMSRRYRYRLLSRVYAKSWRGKVYGAWQKLQQHAESVRFKRLVLHQWKQQRLLTRTFYTMQSIAAVAIWRRRRLLHCALSMLCQCHNRRIRWGKMSNDIAYVYRLVRSYSLLRAIIFSWRRQHLSDMVAMNFQRKMLLIRGLCSLRKLQIYLKQKKGHNVHGVLPPNKLRNRLLERLLRAINTFRQQRDLFFNCPYRTVEFMLQPSDTMEVHARTLRRQSLASSSLKRTNDSVELQASPQRASLYGSPLKYPTPRSRQHSVKLTAAAAADNAPLVAGSGIDTIPTILKNATVADRIAGTAHSPAVRQSVEAVLEIQGAEYRQLDISSLPKQTPIPSPQRAADALESPLVLFSRSFSIDDTDNATRSLRPDGSGFAVSPMSRSPQRVSSFSSFSKASKTVDEGTYSRRTPQGASPTYRTSMNDIPPMSASLHSKAASISTRSPRAFSTVGLDHRTQNTFFSPFTAAPDTVAKKDRVVARSASPLPPSILSTGLTPRSRARQHVNFGDEYTPPASGNIGALTEKNLTLHDHEVAIPKESSLHLSIGSDLRYENGNDYEPSNPSIYHSIAPVSDSSPDNHLYVDEEQSAAAGTMNPYFLRDDVSEFSTVSGGGRTPRGGGDSMVSGSYAASRRAVPLTTAEKVCVRRQFRRWRRFHIQQVRPMDAVYYFCRKQQLVHALDQLKFETSNQRVQRQLVRNSALHHAFRLLKHRIFALQDGNEVESFAANFHIALRLKRCLRSWRQQLRQHQRHLKRLKAASNFRICRKRSNFFVMLRAICQQPTGRVNQAQQGENGGATTAAPRQGLSLDSINKLMQHTK